MHMHSCSHVINILVGFDFPMAAIHTALIENYSDDIDDDDDQTINSPDESHLIYILNMILSGTARLNILLPTATILAFTIFAPILTNDGRCDNLNRWLMGSFLGLSAASCVFFVVTDSFRTTSSGRWFYGVATFRGIWTFNGGRKRPSDPSEYRLRWSDLFHVSLSLVAFLTFAALNNDVVQCYYPEMPRKVTNTVPLVVGFVVSLLFVLFPSKRRGIGYPFLLKRDSLYYRSGSPVSSTNQGATRGGPPPPPPPPCVSPPPPPPYVSPNQHASYVGFVGEGDAC